MKLYRRKELIDDDISYSEFTAELGRSVAEKNREPYLLHRGDGARLLLVIRSSRIMLAVAYGRTRYKVSIGSENTSGSRVFSGLERECMTQDAYFVDPRRAMRAVEAFFNCGSMADYCDFTLNLPDAAILEFPVPFPDRSKTARTIARRKVTVPDSLVRDIAEACRYIESSANDRDVDLDFDDAIQCGGLCGGRIDGKKGLFEFTYFHEHGFLWKFQETLDGLEAISSGAAETIDVTILEGEE